MPTFALQTLMSAPLEYMTVMSMLFATTLSARSIALATSWHLVMDAHVKVMHNCLRACVAGFLLLTLSTIYILFFLPLWYFLDLSSVQPSVHDPRFSKSTMFCAWFRLPVYSVTLFLPGIEADLFVVLIDILVAFCLLVCFFFAPRSCCPTRLHSVCNSHLVYLCA